MRRTQREVEFEVFRGRLARHVRFPDGRGYTHHCTLEVLKQVAFAIEEKADEGVTTQELWDMLADLPTTQISVAFDFLKDRACLETHGRRSYPATDTLYEDAMTEFHYLAHVASERPDASSPPPGF